MKRDSSVDIFAVINFSLAGLSALLIILFILVLVYGMFFSGDTEEEILSGTIGFVILISPAIIAFIIYLIAGIGLHKRRTWGYYMHIVGSVLSFFTIILVAYTIISLVFIFKPEFREQFFNTNYYRE